MKQPNKSFQRGFLLFVLFGLVMLILGASQVALARQVQPASGTPSPQNTESVELGITTTTTLPVTATLDIPPTATDRPIEEPSPTIEEAFNPSDTPSPEPPATLFSGDIVSTPDASLLLTATVTITPTATVTPTFKNLWLPVLRRDLYVEPIKEGTLLSCRITTFDIPDDDPAGVVDSIWIDDARFIQDLNVRLSVNHTWIGDLEARLTHVETGASIRLLSRPGSTNCRWDNPRVILDDEMVLPVSDQCPASDSLAPYMRGGFTPDEPLSSFDGEAIHGEWRLQIADLSPNDTGKLLGWCLSAEVGLPPTPTPPPPSRDLPRVAYISGVATKPQQMPLDCESRVAVDWAKFYGRSIGEYQFFNELPHSDNPDVGFVGNVWGKWGQIPPGDYGVHAEPVAALLRNYNVNAYAHRNLSFDDLKAEIAGGHPVFVWIVGATVDVYGDGYSYPAYYMGKNGNHTLVTPYEHVVMVVGYDEGTDMVTIANEGSEYQRSFEKFLRSWSMMGNMAILSHP